MLVISRQRDETLMIGDDIEIAVVDIRGDKVRLGLTVPPNLAVHRKEVWDAIQRESRAPRTAPQPPDPAWEPVVPKPYLYEWVAKRRPKAYIAVTMCRRMERRKDTGRNLYLHFPELSQPAHEAGTPLPGFDRRPETDRPVIVTDCPFPELFVERIGHLTARIGPEAIEWQRLARSDSTEDVDAELLERIRIPRRGDIGVLCTMGHRELPVMTAALDRLEAAGKIRRAGSVVELV